MPSCHQHLGYLPALADVPDQIRRYLCQQLHLPPTTYTVAEATRPWHAIAISSGPVWLFSRSIPSGRAVVIDAVHQAASTMSDPADLINVAIEHLIQQRFELPAFSTLDRLKRAISATGCNWDVVCPDHGLAEPHTARHGWTPSSSH